MIIKTKNLQKLDHITARPAKSAANIIVLLALYASSTHVMAEQSIIQNAKPAPRNSGEAAGISDVFSDIDMRVRLATKASATSCVANQCEQNLAFDAQVTTIGKQLVEIAAQLYPQHEPLIKRMNFLVLEKQEAGTASNNKGQIVVLRGMQNLQLSDDALGFVLAREMSHVIAGHHKTNTSTKLIISVLASVLFPAVAIIGASSAATQASTATTLITSAASTATSMVGGEVALAKMKPTQLAQADEMALAIMDKSGWDMRSATSILTIDEAPQSAWLQDLATSKQNLQTMIEKEDAEIVLLEDDSQALPEILPEVMTDAVLEDIAENNEQVSAEEVVIIPLNNTDFLPDIPAEH